MLPRGLPRKGLREDIRGIEKIDCLAHTHLDETGSFFYLGLAPCAKNSFRPPKVPVPRQSAGAVSPLFPNGGNSKQIRCAAIGFWSPGGLWSESGGRRRMQVCFVSGSESALQEFPQLIGSQLAIPEDFMQ
jgi:hypothetical protein